nr:MAG TPA: hypothetical protein [Caudoviricetes sp.]
MHPYIGDATCNPRYIDRKLWNYNLSKTRYTKYELTTSVLKIIQIFSNNKHILFVYKMG